MKLTFSDKWDRDSKNGNPGKLDKLPGNAMAVRKVFFYFGPFESVSSLFAEVQYCSVHAPSIEDDLLAPLTHFHIPTVISSCYFIFVTRSFQNRAIL